MWNVIRRCIRDRTQNFWIIVCFARMSYKETLMRRKILTTGWTRWIILLSISQLVPQLLCCLYNGSMNRLSKVAAIKHELYSMDSILLKLISCCHC